MELYRNYDNLTLTDPKHAIYVELPLVVCTFGEALSLFSDISPIQFSPVRAS